MLFPLPVPKKSAKLRSLNKKLFLFPEATALSLSPLLPKLAPDSLGYCRVAVYALQRSCRAHQPHATRWGWA